MDKVKRSLSPEDIMCVICRNEVNYNKKTLDCSGCKKVIKIPLIKGLRVLNCEKCPGLIEIPMIRGLKLLICNNCPGLIEIPLIRGLQTLYCHDCSGLIKIPLIQELQILYCYNCPKLTEISLIEQNKGLTIDCARCRNLTQLHIPTSARLIVDGCVWLNHPVNQHYNKNIKKLIILQKWLKKMLVRKRLIKLIPILIPLYYHPESKGGYFHKKEILEFVESLV